MSEKSTEQTAIVPIDTGRIRDMVYTVRGVQVMLDADLARLYQVETRIINRNVARNANRFPEDFRFQLTKDEFEILKSQIGISSDTEHGGRRTLPYAYTEQGISMLSGVLRSDVAIDVSIGIMRAFVALRHIATQPLPDSNAELRKEVKAIRDELEEILADQNDINEMTQAQLDAISEALAELQAQPRPKRQRIGFVKDNGNEP